MNLQVTFIAMKMNRNKMIKLVKKKIKSNMILNQQVSRKIEEKEDRDQVDIPEKTVMMYL